MSEFPEDVLFVARSLVWPQYLGNEATVERIIIGDCDSWPLVITAAKAILAERERCAKVAEDYDGPGLEYGMDYQLGDANRTINDIASAIRTGTK